MLRAASFDSPRPKRARLEGLLNDIRLLASRPPAAVLKVLGPNEHHFALHTQDDCLEWAVGKRERVLLSSTSHGAKMEEALNQLFLDLLPASME